MRGKIRGRAAISALTLCLLAAALCLAAASQEVSLGQEYLIVRCNDALVGCVPRRVDARKALHDARRELAAEAGGRVSARAKLYASWSREPFRRLMSQEDLEGALLSILKGEAAREGEGLEPAYTVAVGDYRASFASIGDVELFLDRVRDASLARGDSGQGDGGSDEGDGSAAGGGLSPANGGSYGAEVLRKDARIDGLLCAGLVLEEDAPAGAGTIAGVSRRLFGQLGDALSKGAGSHYQEGVLDMAFVEMVDVYESLVSPGELSDMDKAVSEVTKEKESNKVYTVEGGDCLSVIAMDHDTTVDSIVRLNGLESEDAIIREGQELVIAVPEPDLRLRVTVGEVYEEDYEEEPQIIENDSWYTTKEVVRQEGTVGRRERNDIVVYENGLEVSRDMAREKIIEESLPSIIERGTVIPPTYIRPIAGGRLTSGFGMRWGRMHKGVDWATPTGTTVWASSAGTVIQASYNGGYGYNVVIRHPDGRMTRYAHNSKLLVSVGQHVEQGQAIALSGSTGNSTGPHVHFEIYINGVPVNPLDYVGN